MGGYQNYGPNTRCLITTRTQEGTIILTTVHVYRLLGPQKKCHRRCLSSRTNQAKRLFAVRACSSFAGAARRFAARMIPKGALPWSPKTCQTHEVRKVKQRRIYWIAKCSLSVLTIGSPITCCLYVGLPIFGKCFRRRRQLSFPRQL